MLITNMFRDEIVRTLEQAQDCIRGETPEDCSPAEAQQHTLDRIRGALNRLRGGKHIANEANTTERIRLVPR